MEKKVWALVFGVDGFGADTAPALEEGIFLNKEEALEHCIKLNLEQLKENECDIYEGKNDRKVAKKLALQEEPYYGFYCIQETFIR